MTNVRCYNVTGEITKLNTIPTKDGGSILTVTLKTKAGKTFSAKAFNEKRDGIMAAFNVGDQLHVFGPFTSRTVENAEGKSRRFRDLMVRAYGVPKTQEEIAALREAKAIRQASAEAAGLQA